MATTVLADIQIVVNHYEPEESAAAGRPMFSDTTGFGHEYAVMGLEEFANRRDLDPAEVRRILSDRGLIGPRPVVWVRRPSSNL